jgi:sugar/nucleoside kinase (ribokinase family)
VADGPKRLARLLERADVLLCSVADAAAICERSADPIDELILDLQRFGPRRVVLVDDEGGGVAAERNRILRVPPFPDTSPPLDRTGAHDAFAAAVLAALVDGASLADALRRGPVNFMSVSHELGSQGGLLDDEQLSALLADEPGFAVSEWVRPGAAAQAGSSR